MRGLERGFERACERIGWKRPHTAAYVEIEAFIIENLVQQMEQGILAPAPVWSNIKTFNGEIVQGKIDGILGGYPCQPFSVAGQRKGSDDERHLWPHIERIIKTSRPFFCFFENVAGHLTMGFPEVYASLRNMGYAVEAGIFTAEEVGAPHERERLFILAIEMANTTSLRHRRRSEYNDTIYRQSIQSNEGIWTGVRSEIEGCGGNELANPNSFNWGLSESEGRFNNSETTGAGEGELANATIQRLQEPGLAGIGELQTEGGTGLHDRPEQSGNDVANSDLIRRDWPAKPGQPQHEWKEPRIKSRLGFTINGYNYREDLLRMAGNAVVEQTAEVAFINLYNKIKKFSI